MCLTIPKKDLLFRHIIKHILNNSGCKSACKIRFEVECQASVRHYLKAEKTRVLRNSLTFR